MTTDEWNPPDQPGPTISKFAASGVTPPADFEERVNARIAADDARRTAESNTDPTEPTEPTLSPGAIERHVLPTMDLLERAADLIHDRWDGMSPDSVGQRWLTDYRKLCRDE